MSYPNRLEDLCSLFGRTKSDISGFTNYVMKHIYNKYHHLLSFSFLNWSRQHYSDYARAIHDKGSPLRHVVGFLDGTVRPICRPRTGQQEVYNGHKRIHAVKYQALTVPCGLIGHLYGPVPGIRHDSGILRDSGLLEYMQDRFDIDDIQYYVYGDPAYPHSPWLQKPYGVIDSELKQEFNAKMSAVRMAVEWSFADVLQHWAFNDYRKNLKLDLQPIGMMYIVSVLLTNMKTCLRGNQISSYFNLTPPTIETYLSIPSYTI